MTTPYRLYGAIWTRATGPLMVLKELELEHEVIPVDTLAGEHREEAFLRINPAGYLPALTTPEGEHLHEAAAIMLYLAERHGAGRLVPAADETDRGRFLSLYFFLTNDIQPPAKRFFYPQRYALHPEDVAETRARAHAATLERWAVLESELAGRGPWHLGERFSLADIQVALWAAYGLIGPDDIISRFPTVQRIFEAVRARPKSGPCLDALREAMAARRAARTRAAERAAEKIA